jgi:N-acetylmuramoyl-L-alanine amidase
LPKAQNTIPAVNQPPAAKVPEQQAVAVDPPGFNRNTVPAPPKKVFTNIYGSAPTKRASETSKSTESNTNVQFFVQLAASSKLQDTQTSKWNKIGYPIEVIREKEMYKYRARNFNDLKTAQLAKDEIRKKGFPDAFVVAYQNGVRISMAEALKAN